VRDAAARPLLGLSLAQRLAELLGGDLRIDSPGTSVCNYRLTVAAEPADQSVWLDPSTDGAQFGPVRPGRVLFVGGCERTVDRSRSALERAGYIIERAAREELVLARLQNEPTRWSAVLVDATCAGATLLGFVDALRGLGFGAALVALVQDSSDAGKVVSGLDAMLYDPNGSLLLKALRDARDYKDRKNAISAS